MPSGKINKKIIRAFASAALVFAATAYFFIGLRPAQPAPAAAKFFKIEPGESFRDISNRLAADGVVRSTFAFKLLSVLTGEAGKLKPGIYELSPSISASGILSQLVSGSRREVAVTIPEGFSIYEIDKALGDIGVIKTGELVNAASARAMEGELFPDTYKFFTDSEVAVVLGKFSENFSAKTGQLFEKSGATDIRQTLTIASMLEKEVPDAEDRKIVAGILKKRLKSGIPLQADATICHIKRIAAYPGDSACYPLTPLDFKIESPYNTYLHTGLPPTPIGNPGFSAINAALNPKTSPYWYYLSDPKTRKTIFSQTLDEQERNRIKYLKS